MYDPMLLEGHRTWASDSPHPDRTWPHSRAVLEREMAHLDAARRLTMTRDNARAFDGLCHWRARPPTVVIGDQHA
jgi:hypothetical protein